MNKCIKGKSCLHCNTDYCRFKDEVAELKAENERLKARLRPLEDSYFNGLSSIEIAELAKKSIRITAENRKLEDALQEIKEIVNKAYYTEDYMLGQRFTELVDAINLTITNIIGAEE